jgi:hypothetical protein
MNQSERCTPDRVRSFVKGGADPNAINKFGNTVLIEAINVGVVPAAIEALLEAGASPMRAGQFGITPIIALAMKAVPDDGILNILLRRGASVNGQDAQGWTALMHALINTLTPPQFIQSLLKNGADPAITNRNGDTARAIGQKELQRFAGHADLSSKLAANLKLLPDTVPPGIPTSPPTGSTQVRGLSAGPTIPYITQNICPNEGCRYGEQIAETRTVVYLAEGDVSRPAFVIEAGDIYTSVRGNVHTRKPGIVVSKGTVTVKQITGATLGFTQGAVIYVLTYLGEGIFDVWYDSRVYRVFKFWEDERSAGDKPQAVLLQWPQTSWWVYVRNRRGQAGWIKAAEMPEPLLEPLLQGTYRGAQGFLSTNLHPDLFHLGQDYCVENASARGASLIGARVFPIADGVVKAVRYSEPANRSDGVGNYVVIDHLVSGFGGIAVTAAYMHLAKVAVKNGQFVQTSDALGEAGDVVLHPPPNCAHLHLELRKRTEASLNVTPNLRYGYVSSDGQARLLEPLAAKSDPEAVSEEKVKSWAREMFYDANEVLTKRIRN